MVASFLPQVDEYEKCLRSQKTKQGHCLSECSIKNYKQKINCLLMDGFELILDDPKALIKKLEDKYASVNSRKSALMAIIKYIKTVNPSSENILSELGKEYMKLSNEYTAIYDKNKRTMCEEDNWMDYKDVLKLKSKIKKDPQFLVLFKIYTEFPPVRNDVYNLKYQNYDKNTENYFDIKNKEIVINEYKEDKVHGAVKLELGKTLFNNMKKLTNDSGDDYVFHNLQSNPFADSKVFSTYFKRKFKAISGKNIGTAMLRKIFMTHFSETNPTLEERKKVASIMGHTITTGLGYNKKNSAAKKIEKP